jgi:hypothetical protein
MLEEQSTDHGLAARPGGAASVLDDASGRIAAAEGRRTQGRLRLQQSGVLRVVQADGPDAGGHHAEAGMRGRPELSERQRMRVQLLQRPKHSQRLETGRGQALDASALTRSEVHAERRCDRIVTSDRVTSSASPGCRRRGGTGRNRQGNASSSHRRRTAALISRCSLR